MAKKTVPLPQPSTAPFIGNLADIDMDYPTGSMLHLAKKYGAIYKLSLAGQDLVIISNWDLVNEVCDDSRFKKSIKGDLEARGDEENWGVAHRVLMSAFGPLSIKNMFDEMHEVASQLALKWARQGPSEAIDIGEDLTRLTLDTVALCSMGFRFNSYYRQDLHPFIKAMYAVLVEAGQRGMRFLPGFFYHSEDRKFLENIKLLRTTASQVIDARKLSKGGDSRRDLLTAMMEGVDAQTGRKMTDESIIDNLITFLVAGHETTAATFQFTMYNLLKHPECYRKVQEEIDTVIGTGSITLEHIPKLKYLAAVLRETLRLNAPITIFAREPIKDEIVGGKYLIKAGTQIGCFLSKSQSDPKVWGPDADEFNPERMLDENFDRIQKEFPHSWSPFGTGMRGCIGRQFAWQELLLAFAVLLQNFNFVMDNPSYTLQVTQALTVKPKDLYVRAIPRDGLTPSQLEARLAGSFRDNAKTRAAKIAPVGNGKPQVDSGKKIAIYYGSNAGTCEYMAQRLASDAAEHGFTASVDTLDVAKEAVPVGVPVVIIISSYEGQPPQNASHFVNWMESLSNDELKDVKYAVWGCGHSDWAKTYHRVPQLVDTSFEKLGAKRIAPIGTTDAKDRDMFSDFEVWEDETLWPAIANEFGGNENGQSSPASLQVSFSAPRVSHLRQDVKEALVVNAKCLTKANVGGEKRHIEIQLPGGWSYIAGDYLAVLPHNPKQTVARAMRRFHLAWDSHVSIQASTVTTLPTGGSLPVSEVLSSYVELSQAATKRNLSTLIELAKDAQIKAKLEHLAADDFDHEVRAKKLSILDLLEQFPSLLIPFQHFLSMLPPMRVRQYSISSSNLAQPGRVTLTYGVLDVPAYSGVGRHVGVASSYLSTLQAGDKIQVAMRNAAGGFHLPLEVDKTSIICIAAGTGLAPFRAFIQERAILQSSGQKLAPALLFNGCRDPEDDDLYRDEFDAWEDAGVVTVFRAFSRRTDASAGCKYVQDRLWLEREEVVKLWNKEARIYVCGSTKLAESVKEVLVRIIQEENEKSGQPVTEEEAAEWFEKHRNERFATDVFD
ncbi:uncharacterized protein JN550_007304 [Neoarthrinium moseri]|uniref:uncharacterized protein n=1 Tax=Neoarthrinium moseri TaxID=1658444 RepID=UPI001FDCF62E|nr:uncharacterized protein JN550_007304 [Neoarthrinium moseri]KAI1866757.1 hypothetical protein JN550_007304 [Neoarthrinium moseri]